MPTFSVSLYPCKLGEVAPRGSLKGSWSCLTPFTRVIQIKHYSESYHHRHMSLFLKLSMVIKSSPSCL